MAKKKISGLDGLLKKTTPPPSKEPVKEELIKEEPIKTKKEKPTSTSKIGTKIGETRATFIVNEELLDAIKAIAIWDRASIKEVIHEALQEYIEKQPDKKMKQALDFYNKKKSGR